MNKNSDEPELGVEVSDMIVEDEELAVATTSICGAIESENKSSKTYYKNSSSSNNYLIGLEEPLIEDRIDVTELPLCEGTSHVSQIHHKKFFLNKEFEESIGSPPLSKGFSIPDTAPSDVSGIIVIKIYF